MTGAQILACDGVSRHFGSLAAVDQLSFTVDRGEVLGIGGPNGAGKTTLFDVITGLQPATSGRVLLGEHDITRDAPHEICRRGVARTFQLNAGFDTLTVLENVLVAAYFGQANRGLPGLRIDRASRARAEEALAFVGLGGRGAEIVGRLPVLDRKLLMIAGAVATEPRIVLLDEPVGGLNPSEIGRVMEMVQRLVGRGITVILIEHVMRFLLALSTRVLIMHHGKKLFEGRPEQVAEDERVVETYLGRATTERLRKLFAKDAAHG